MADLPQHQQDVIGLIQKEKLLEALWQLSINMELDCLAWTHIIDTTDNEAIKQFATSQLERAQRNTKELQTVVKEKIDMRRGPKK